MSLNLRIILSATMVLVIFISLIAAALDRAFVDSTETALRDKLTSQVYALMAAAEIDHKSIIMPSDQLEFLLGLPSSGVYAYISNRAQQILWQSSSTLGAKPPPPESLASGKKQFLKSRVDADEYYVFSYGVNWATDNDSLALTFTIATDLQSFNQQISDYRATLWSWLLAMALLLLVSQAMILRWGLSPLRKVGEELNRIENGEQEQIEAPYPREIDRLTQNINMLLLQERKQKTRYRNALGDLAHSLKTPLAVLQSGFSGKNNEQSAAVQEQITRMNSIVEYQLQRAATAGSASIGKSVDVKSVLDRMLVSLQKVYRDKPITLSIHVDEKLIFRGDEGDLMELLGNLLDNAYKWTNESIEIYAEAQGDRLSMRVIDDGPGIKPDQVEILLQRGMRADQAIDGHGIGLSIVSSIIDAYDGHFSIQKSSLGGCEVSIVL